MALRPESPAIEPGSGLLVPELMTRVQRIHFRTHKLVNTALAGSYRSTFRGQGIEFEDVRPYIPGDDVRAIDWNVTARTGEPYVKSYREERELTVHLLVDAGLSMDFGTRRWTKREAAAQFSGLISMVALRNQDRVGLTLFGHEPGLHLGAAKGQHHVMRVIRGVVSAPAEEKPSDVNAILETAERTLRRRSLVFLVSDFLGARDEAWVDVLARLGRRHDVIAVRVVDPFEEQLPPVGLMTMRSLSSGELVEVDASASAVRDAWEAAARRRRDRIHDCLARARVDRFDLRVEEDLAEPLVAFFRRRETSRGNRRGSA